MNTEEHLLPSTLRLHAALPWDTWVGWASRTPHKLAPYVTDEQLRAAIDAGLLEPDGLCLSEVGQRVLADVDAIARGTIGCSAGYVIEISEKPSGSPDEFIDLMKRAALVEEETKDGRRMLTITPLCRVIHAFRTSIIPSVERLVEGALLNDVARTALRFGADVRALVVFETGVSAMLAHDDQVAASLRDSLAAQLQRIVTDAHTLYTFLDFILDRGPALVAHLRAPSPQQPEEN